VKFSKILFLAFVLSFPSLAFSLVRLKGVTHSGHGTQGTIKVEFNGNYDSKKSSLTLLEDRAEITIPEAFVIPVKRVYKPSSNSSSVIKMEVNQIPGNTVRLSVFFRVPMSIIKNSAKLSGTSNSVILNYSIDAPALESNTPVASSTKESDSKSEPESTDNSNIDEPKAINKENIKTVQSDISNNDESFLDEKKNIKKESSSGFGLAIARMLGALLIVIGLFLAGVYLFKKYLSGGISLGMKKKNFDTPIKMISTVALAPGKTLYLVDVMGEKLLLSAGKDGLQLVSKINPIISGNDEILSSDNFNDNIDDINDIPEVSIPSPMSTSDIKTKLKERLRNIKGT